MIKKGKFNVTVDSPLIETEKWYEDHKNKFQNVDVETYHIVKAYESYKGENEVKIVPGLFISDVLKDEPLNEKIGSNAYEHFGDLLKGVFLELGVSV